MVHLVDHVLEGAGHPGHLQPHIEPFGHAEIFHDIGELLLGHVDGTGGAHLAGQFQPVFVDVGDHHVTGANVTADGSSHDADGACAGDEHVFTHQVEGEGGVHGVAERIEDGGQLIGDVVRQLEGVEGRDHQVFGEGTRAVHTHTNGVAAQVGATGTAVAAVAAGDVAFAGDAIADGEAAHFLADGDHLSHILVPHHHGDGNGLLGPLVPVVDVHVGAADGGLADLDEQIVVAELGSRDIGHPDADFGFEFGECFHDRFLTAPCRVQRVIKWGPTLAPVLISQPCDQITPSSRPMRMKASIALSSCSRVWAADIWVRMRA